MGSTFSDLLRFEKMATGEKSNTWGVIANGNVFELLEDAIAGYVAVNCAGGVDVTLTASSGAADQARMAILKFTGILTGNINVIIPSSSKDYIVWNATTGSFTLTVKTSGGTGLLVAQSRKAAIFCDGTDTYEVGVTGAGKQSVWVPAAAIVPVSTNGADPFTVTELTAGRPELHCLAFDQTTDEAGQFSIRMPKSWNEGTITFQAYWAANSTSTNSVVWGLQGVAISDDDPIASVYGTAVTVTDANKSTARDLNVTAESSAITIGGTPAVEDLCFFRIYRDADNGSDNLAVDAELLGVMVFFTIDAATDD